MKKLILDWIFPFIVGIAMIGTLYTIETTSYNRGLEQGMDIGFISALDTCNAILAKQLKSDTSVTKLVLIHPDTNTYIISRRTMVWHRKKR